MNIPGPTPVSPVQSVNDLQNGLRLNQRLTGEVVQVNGMQVQVSVDGVPLVARMTSQEQAVLLNPGQTAHFVVKDLSGGTVTLQLLRPGTSAEGSPTQAQAAGIAGRVLAEAGIPLNPETLLAARALLSQGLEVTPEGVASLLQALGDAGNVNEESASLAAALRAAGIPVTAQSLALFSRAAAGGNPMVDLLQQLRAAAGAPDVFPGTLGELQRALASLETSMPAWDSPAGLLAGQLRTAVSVLGQSLESLAAALIGSENGARALNGRSSLLDLARLGRLVGLKSKTGLLNSLQEMLQNLRQSQLVNTAQDKSPSAGVWAVFDFVLRAPAQNGEDFYPARLCIARRKDSGITRIDPEYTRLVIQVELGPQNVVQVDLSLVQHNLNLELTVPDEAFAARARQQLDDLELRLHDLGYTLAGSSVKAGQPARLGGIPAPHLDELSLQAINMKV